MLWESILKEKCRKMGCRCKVRNRGKKLYARVLDWQNPNAIQSILETIKADFPDAMITSGCLPNDNGWGRFFGDITFRLNP